MPSNFDANYCYSLGYTAGVLIDHMKNGYISTVRYLDQHVSMWQPAGIPFTRIMEVKTAADGSTFPAVTRQLVDLDGPLYKVLCEVGNWHECMRPVAMAFPVWHYCMLYLSRGASNYIHPSHSNAFVFIRCVIVGSLKIATDVQGLSNLKDLLLILLIIQSHYQQRKTCCGAHMIALSELVVAYVPNGLER